jgi:hypothetical protein
MQSELEMTDLYLMKYFLGNKVEQSAKGIFIFQQKYAIYILKRFKMNKCNLTDTEIVTCTKLFKQDQGTTIDYTLYKRIAGILMYVTTTWPYIMNATSLISIFMENLKISHWKARKRILRYMVGTTNYGIWYSNSEDDSLVGHTYRYF